MKESRLPQGGANLFQEIKAVSKKAEDSGQKLIKLSIGQPSGPALKSARVAAAEAVLREEESMHEYQDNGSPGVLNFAKRFVAGHVLIPGDANVDYLPIPGIKPMLGLIPMACGKDLRVVATTTNPGYPTPRDWCHYLDKLVAEPTLKPSNNFLFDCEELKSPLPGLVMTNYPHNPSGAVATKEWWEKLCAFCEEHEIRLFNDAAYSALVYDSEACCLSSVALNFPNLSWVEAFSASKLIGNGTGWRVGAMIGSPDFIGDIKTIKGNTDSGFVAPMAVGVLNTIEHDTQGITEVAEKYRSRLQLLIEILSTAGMKLATEPKAGFFSLWQAPKYAFGREMKDARDFNFTMIEETGVVGVHFGKYIRYAVASADIDSVSDELIAAFARAEIKY